MRFSQQISNTSVNNINSFICVMGTDVVLCEVGFEVLFIMELKGSLRENQSVAMYLVHKSTDTSVPLLDIIYVCIFTINHSLVTFALTGDKNCLSCC
jgi:hypothetical protein